MLHIQPLNLNDTAQIKQAYALRIMPDNAPGISIETELISRWPNVAAYKTWLAERLNWHPNAVALAYRGTDIVGLCEFGNHLKLTPQMGYVFGIHTAAHARSQGVGRAMISYMEGHMRACGFISYCLSTTEQNTHAHAFYQAMGMVNIGRREDKPYLFVFEKTL